MASDAQRLAKAAAVMQTPGIDQYQAGIYFLRAMQLDEETVARLLPQPDPNAPPPPEAQKLMADAMKSQAEAILAQAQAEVAAGSQQIEQLRLAILKQDADTRMAESTGRIQKMSVDTTVNAAKIQLSGSKEQHRQELQTAQFIQEAKNSLAEQEYAALKTAVEAKLKDKKIEVEKEIADIKSHKDS